MVNLETSCSSCKNKPICKFTSHISDLETEIQTVGVKENLDEEIGKIIRVSLTCDYYRSATLPGVALRKLLDENETCKIEPNRC